MCFLMSVALKFYITSLFVKKEPLTAQPRCFIVVKMYAFVQRRFFIFFKFYYNINRPNNILLNMQVMNNDDESLYDFVSK